MTLTREAVVQAAQSCKGTPYRHQGRLKGVGLDCVGLVLTAFTEAGWRPRDVEVTRNISYALMANEDTMKRLLENETRPVALSGVQPADVLLFQFGEHRWPNHLGLVSQVIEDEIYFIHAFNSPDSLRVCEGRLADKFVNVFVGAYSFPEFDEAQCDDAPCGKASAP